MAQSQGYKRFRSSINTIHQGTSTPQTSHSKIFPRSSTPNRRSIEHIEQATIPVVPSPHPVIKTHHKVSKKQRRQHRSNPHYQIHIDHIVLIQQQKPCSRCHCKKRKSRQILGVL